MKKRTKKEGGRRKEEGGRRKEEGEGSASILESRWFGSETLTNMGTSSEEHTRDPAKLVLEQNKHSLSDMQSEHLSGKMATVTQGNTWLTHMHT
jgi:hypothetical protein